MNMPLFFTLFGLLLALSLWIGKKVGAKDNNDYYLSGRTVGIFPLAMTFFATQFGGGAIMGAAEEAYTRGWEVIFYPLGMVLGLLVLGLGFGAKMRRLNLSTVAELFEVVYRSPRMRQFAALLSILALFFILVAQGIAAKKFFASLGLNGDVLYTIFWLVLVAYTVMGGLRAVINNDIFQGAYILVAFAIAAGVIFWKGDFSEAATLVTQDKTIDVPWLTWLLMPLLFMLIEQDMGQRCFAAKKPITVSLASILAALALLACCLCPIYFGVEAAKAGIVAPEGSSVFIASIKGLTNPTIATILVCAVLMAIISTADALLNSICSNLSLDFPILKKRSVRFSQALTFLVGITTFVLSFIFNNVLTMLMFSYELSVSVLCVPVLMATLKKNPSKSSALVSMAVGGAGFLFFRGLPYKELWTLGAAFLSFILTEIYVRRFIAEKVETGASTKSDTTQ